jgi:uncharacterized protein DUF6934
MHKSAYVYDRNTMTRYTFTSTGRRRIEKGVEFTNVGIENTFNLAFGDLLPDGSIDDTANSNNGDIIKVLTTVINILKEFTEKNPKAYVAFTGSTPERTKLYGRILRSYYSTFSKYFKIKAYIRSGDTYTEFEFDPEEKVDYEVFLVKRII